MITLASQSMIRREILENAGVSLSTVKAAVDEEMVKASLKSEGAGPRDIADALAELKAARVAQSDMGYVLGCDQILAFEGEIISKAKDLAEARARLSAFSGKSHRLYTAAVFYHQGQPIWRAVTKADMHMHALSSNQIDRYLEKAGDEILGSVGCYHLEGLGAQLFSKIDGDYFTVLGLPLIEILSYLRLRGILA